METITAATPADAPALTALINRAYRSEQGGWTAEGHLLEGPRIDEAGLLAMLALPHAQLLKAETDGIPTGCVYLEAQGEVLYLSLLAVAPEAQAHGLGRQLLAAADAYARQLRRTKVRMSVLAARPELLAWYERHGYQPTGASEPFPATTRFGRPRQPLTLLTLEKNIDNS
ncbi:GNAT family N-acetyltransferase [Hymenobacter baengnokdamensis]|uniref:GNAT family N-acetyltransferase n=1 Tax=Hymenobacter baengnokdamensis TaxID=2615203 RepID=UPI001243B7A6|nr:GNAT family N-acetyltransferase [Hymenobacter baengnokdamensis]